MSLAILLNSVQGDLSWLAGSSCLLLMRTLAHFAWQGSAIAIVFLVINLALRHRSANARYFFGVATLLSLAVCPLLTFCLLSPPARGNVVAVESTVELATSDSNTSRALVGRARSPSRPQFDQVKVGRVVAGVNLPAAPTTWLKAVSPYAVAVYAFGVVVMLLRLGLGLWAGWRLCRTSIVVIDEPIQSLVRRSSERWAMRVVPLVACCQQVAVPAVVGILRPMILLPPAMLTGLSVSQLEAMLIHELAHIRRWDLAVNLAQRVIEALLFVHPAVWYVSHRISVERENACDDLVLSTGWQSQDYVSALLSMADLCASQRNLSINTATLLAASGERPSELKQRVLRLLGESAAPSPRLTRSGFSGVLVAASMLVLASTVMTLRPESKAQSGNDAPTEIVEDVEKNSETFQTASDDEVTSQTLLHLGEHLTDVVIKGLSTIPNSEALKHIKSRPGNSVTEAQIKDDVDALVRTRWFASVQPELHSTDKKMMLVFRVLERPIVRRVEYKGLKKVKQRVFDALTQLKPGSPFDIGANRECARRIAEYYHEKGFAFATVELEKGNDRDDREVVFLINEGPKVHVTAVTFDGNENLVDEVLSTKTRTKTRVVSLFGGHYDPSTIKADIAGINSYYHSLGYFDVGIKEHLKFSDDKSKVELRYEIDEGTRYKIGNIIVRGNEALSDEEIRQLMKVTSGVLYNAHDVKEDADAIRNRYGEEGSRFCKVDTVPIWREKKGVVDIVYNIDEDKFYRVRHHNVRVLGDRSIAEKNHVRDIRPIQSGDLADPKQIQIGTVRLENSQEFVNRSKAGVYCVHAIQPDDLADPKQIQVTQPRRRENSQGFDSNDWERTPAIQYLIWDSIIKP